MDDQPAVETAGQRRISRRSMMKAGVAAGGAAWVAPTIIESFASPAAAGSAPPATVPCLDLKAGSISYLALVVEGPAGTYSLVKITKTSTKVKADNTAAVPCGSGTFATVPYTLTGSAYLTDVTFSAVSVTFTVPAGETVVYFVGHGKSLTAHGSTCDQGHAVLGPGTYTITTCATS